MRLKLITKIRRLAQLHFAKDGRFLSLTFNDRNDFDIKSLTECYPRFKAFIHRLRIEYGSFKYVMVAKFQDKNNRGAVHYHLLYNLPYIPQKDLACLWGHGFVDIRKIRGGIGAGLYLAKYLMKSYIDPRFQGHRKYTTTKHLESPPPIYGPEAMSVVKRLEAAKAKQIYQNAYDSPFNGQVKISVYNSKQFPAQKVQHGK